MQREMTFAKNETSKSEKFQAHKIFIQATENIFQDPFAWSS